MSLKLYQDQNCQAKSYAPTFFIPNNLREQLYVDICTYNLHKRIFFTGNGKTRKKVEQNCMYSTCTLCKRTKPATTTFTKNIYIRTSSSYLLFSFVSEMKYLGVISGVNDNYRPTRISVFVPCLLQLKPPNLICRHFFLSLKLEKVVHNKICVFCEINVAIIIKLSGLLN